MAAIYHFPEYIKSCRLYPSFGTDLKAQSENDYPGKNYFQNEYIPSIDLDLYERKRAGNNDCTSDAAIGIATLADTQLENRRALLVELRMGYDNSRNLDFVNINRKFIHSLDILRENEISVNSELALIFNESISERAKSVVKNWSREDSKHVAAKWSVFNPENFCNHINYGKSIPVEPKRATVIKTEKWLENKSPMSYDEFDRLAMEIEIYWWELKARYLKTDLEFLALKLLPHFETIKFRGDKEEKELCMVRLRDLKDIITTDI